MKQNYTNKTIQLLIMSITLLIGTTNYAQNIQFTFMNAVNTNDGIDDFYETDIMIETIDGQVDFKLGSGQIYFNYNETAFGTNINASTNYEATTVYPEYFLGQNITVPFPFEYYSFVINDNTTSTVSWSFSENISANSMTKLVTSTPRKLLHLKIKYVDVNQSPDVEFNTSIVDSTSQFFTACGGTGSVDCTGFPGTQFVNATFDNSNAVLSLEEQNQIAINQIKIYPNPTDGLVIINSPYPIEKIEVYSLLGKKAQTFINANEINLKDYSVGIYAMKIITDKGIVFKKLILK